MAFNPSASNWRQIGNAPRAAIIQDMHRVASPMLDDFDATYKAAQPHTALFFAQAWLENRYKTTGILIKPEHHNPVSLRPERIGLLGPYGYGLITAPDNSQFLVFKTDADCAREWRRRLVDEASTYKGGVYAATTTLESLLAVFTPSGDVHPVTGVDNADINYAATVRTALNRYAALEASTGTQGESPMALNFDPNLVPYPPYEFQLAMRKIDGVGQDDLGKRTFRGIAWHRGVTGNQTLDGAVGYLIAPTTRGLTDGYIDNVTGRVVIMNPMVTLFPEVLKLVPNWADRAGWANGPYQSGVASSDARAFVAKFGARLGANIVNQDLESYEILGNYETPISPKTKRVMAQIAANRAQRNKIPWDSFPVNPATGVTEMFGHREFCGEEYKECPGRVIWEFINSMEFLTMVRDILRAAQVEGKRVSVDGAVVPTPTPAPTPAPAPAPAPTPKKKLATIRFESLLRTSPGFWDYEKNKSNVVATLPAGTKAEVISGPRVVEGIPWYDLRIDGIGTGWVADTVLHTMNIQEAA